MARPREYDREALAIAFKRYIAETEIPIVAEFAYQNGVTRELLYEWEAPFPTLLKDCIEKKEASLERSALKGDVNIAMAIFSLKQLGWTDKQDTTLRGDKKAPLQFSSTDAEL